MSDPEDTDGEGTDETVTLVVDDVHIGTEGEAA